MEFGEAVRTCLKEKYVNFSGRATRSEYWYFYLFNMICYFIGSLGYYLSPGIGHFMTGAVGIAFCLPSIGAAVRRLHDTNKTGWYMLFALIPFIGWIILIVLLCKKGTAGPNRFGI